MRRDNLVTIDFSTPTSLDLNDRVSLRDIHTKLVDKGWSGEKFTDWLKSRLEFYENGKDYTQLREKTNTGKGASGWQVTEEFYVTVQVAMEILANGHGHVGHDMRRFMSACVRKVVENPYEQIPSNMDSDFLYRLAENTKRLEEAKREAERVRHTIHEGRECTSTARLGGVTAAKNKLQREVTELRDRLGESDNWKTLSGWYNIFPQLSSLGASEAIVGRLICKEAVVRGIELRQTPHQTWGKIKLYPKELIQLVLEDSSVGGSL